MKYRLRKGDITFLPGLKNHQCMATANYQCYNTLVQQGMLRTKTAISKVLPTRKEVFGFLIRKKTLRIILKYVFSLKIAGFTSKHEYLSC